jgi:hypothetical protein
MREVGDLVKRESPADRAEPLQPLFGGAGEVFGV